MDVEAAAMRVERKLRVRWKTLDKSNREEQGKRAATREQRRESRRLRIVFELAEVAVFELLHEGFALEDVALEIGGKLAGNDEKLVVDHSGERDGAAGGNEMRAPLKHEAEVPQNEEGEKSGGGSESGAIRTEELRGAIEENAEAENEERSKRNEKTIAIRRDAVPIGVASDQEIESEEGGQKGSAGAALPAPENKKAGDGEEKNGRPGEEAVIGREKHLEESGRGPEPVAEGNVAGFERVAVDEVARDERGQHTEEDDSGEKEMAEEELGNAQRVRKRRTHVSGNVGGRQGFGGLDVEGEIVAAGDFDGKNGEDHGVGVVHVEHEAGDQGEKQPLSE